jgi:hypothetical protein
MRMALAYALLRQGQSAAAEREARAALAPRALNEVVRAELNLILAEARLAQGDPAGALLIAREVSGPGPRTPPAMRLLARGVEVEALLAIGERDAARALLGAARAEILAVAAGIEDEALRASFLARGHRAARLLRLASAEGLGAAADAGAAPSSPSCSAVR